MNVDNQNLVRRLIVASPSLWTTKPTYNHEFTVFWTNIVLCCAYYTGESSFEVQTEADNSENTEHSCDDRHGIASDKVKQDGNAVLQSSSHDKEKIYQCYVCHKMFAHSGHLNYHIRIHMEEKPYNCSLCDKNFTRYSNLMGHKRRMHNRATDELKEDEKFIFKCSVCSKVFASSGELVRHTRAHSGEKPYKCPVCGNAFSQSGNLSCHMRVHTGEQPYNCSLCNKRFSKAVNLQRHIREVHNIASDEVKQDVSAVTNSGIYSENMFRCYVCGKLFHHSGHLKRHMRVHASEDQYMCSLCNESFTTSGELQLHEHVYHVYSRSTDELSLDENVKFECVSGDWSAEDKEESLETVQQVPDDVRCVFYFVSS